MLVKGHAVEKAVKRPVAASRRRNPGAILRAAPETAPQLPPGGLPFSFPKGFHTCGKVLWIRMAVTSVEQAAQGVWVRVTEKARGELPEGSYTMWFSEVRPTSLEGDILQLSVPSEYVRDWLIRHYLPLIQTAASEAAGSPVRVQVIAEPPPERDAPEAPDEIAETPRK